MKYKITIEDEDGTTIQRNYNIEMYSIINSERIGDNIIDMIGQLNDKEVLF